MDRELGGGKPAKESHRKVVGTAVIDSKLLFKVCKGIKAVTRIKALLALTVAALNLTIMPWGIRSDELVANAKFLRCRLKQRGQIPLTVGKAVGELKAVVCLDTLHPDAPAGIPLHQLFQEISRGKGGLLRIGSQKAQTGKLVNSSILKQAKFRICDAASRNNFHIHLDSLPGKRRAIHGISDIRLISA